MNLKKVLEEYMKEDDSPSGLNPLLFDGEKLKPEVRDKVLEIVSEFMKFSQSESVDIMDVRLVGSNAAYNYTPNSDLDIHILVDLSKVSSPEIIGRLYFDSIKSQFKKSYDITIKGIEVEVYVEDINTTSVSNGIYSVTQDEWVRKPTEGEEPSEDLKKEAEDKAEEIISSFEEAEDINDLQSILDKVYVMRKDSLSSEGETGIGNLTFKILRNRGVLSLVNDTIRDSKSKELSLESKNLLDSKIPYHTLNRAYTSHVENHRASVKNIFNEVMKPILESEGVGDHLIEEISSMIENHDLSKYSGKEFSSYRDRYYGEDLSTYKSRLYEYKGVSPESFDIARNHHQKCNPHHWNYWVVIEGVDPKVRPLDMPLEYVVEMLCDWQSKCRFNGSSAKVWYEENKDKMILSEATKRLIEKYIDHLD